MGDPQSRKSAAAHRLRTMLKKKRESLADHFDFKMFTVFHFKDEKKKRAVFEMTEVVPAMTNNYIDGIMKGVTEECYSYESSQELLAKDVVQLHAPRWQSLRRDVIGCTTLVDFFLWPRNDISKIQFHLFSRWKGDTEYKPIQASFVYHEKDYTKQLIKLVHCRENDKMIINDPTQTAFLFVNKQISKTKTHSHVLMFKLHSVCLYLPQDQLTNWGAGSIEEIVSPYT